MRSFQDILEKRVRNTNNITFDFYSIEKVVKNILRNVYGQSGINNVVVKKIKDQHIILSSNKSLWRSELVLNKKRIISSINKKFKKTVVKSISVI